MSKKEFIKRVENQKKLSLNKDYQYLLNLNDEQKIIATQIYGNFLIMGSAGTGKTQTIIYRIVHLISQQINPQEICIITNSTIEKNNLLKKIQYVLPGLNLGFIGTVYELNYYIIKNKFKDQYRLLSEHDSTFLISQIIYEKGYNINSAIKPELILKIFHQSMEYNFSIEQTLSSLNLHNKLLISQLSLLKKDYENKKSELKYLNIYNLIEFYKNKNCENDFNYLLVDDYQYLSPNKEKFIEFLKIDNNMIFLDLNQGTHDNLQLAANFYFNFKNSQIITLNKNYRSNETIVEKLNDIIASSDLEYKQPLIAMNKEKSPIKIIPNYRTNISHFIDNLDLTTGQKNIILYEHEEDKIILEKELKKSNINYLVEGNENIWNTNHIINVLSIFLSLYYPQDYLALRQIKKLFPKALKKKHDNLMNLQKENIHTTLYQVIIVYSELELIEPTEYEKIEQYFHQLLNTATAFKNPIYFYNYLIFNPQYNTNPKANVILTSLFNSKSQEYQNSHLIHHKNEKNLNLERSFLYMGISRVKDELIIYDTSKRLRSLDQIILSLKKPEPTNEPENTIQPEQTATDKIVYGKNKKTFFLLWLFLGVFGGHRFYLDDDHDTNYKNISDHNIGTIYLFTLGLFLIGWLADLKFLFYEFED